MTQPARRPAERKPADRKPSDRKAAERKATDRKPAGAATPDEDQAPGRTPPAAKPASRTGRTRAGSATLPAVPDRSLITTVPGVSALAAVGLAAVLTAIGVLADLTRAGTLAAVFTVCYVVGCVLGVAWVRRSGLFGPMVAPPLLLAVSIPVVVLLAGTPKPGAGVAERLLVIGAPLVNSFPTMAWTTGIVVAIGAFRLFTQRLDRDAVSPPPAPPAAPGAARGAARTSRSPRRS